MSEQANTGKIRQLGDDVNHIYKSLGRLEKTLTQHSARFAGVESRLDSLAVGQRQLREQAREFQGETRARFGVVDTKLDRVLVILGEPTE
jgi:hypothetical protein